MICHRPENMLPRSGIHTAPTRKARLSSPKNSFKKSLSERFLIFFIMHPSILCVDTPFVFPPVRKNYEQKGRSSLVTRSPRRSAQLLLHFPCVKPHSSVSHVRWYIHCKQFGWFCQQEFPAEKGAFCPGYASLIFLALVRPSGLISPTASKDRLVRLGPISS